MFFRPNFCANCGEKVERAEWGPLTSRRFCIICESEFKGRDLIPRVVVMISLLIGVLGVGAYMRSADVSGSTAVASRQPLRSQPQTLKPAEPPTANTSAATRSNDV